MPDYQYFVQVVDERSLIYPTTTSSGTETLSTRNVRVKYGDTLSIGNIMTLNASYRRGTTSTEPIYNGIRYSEGDYYNNTVGSDEVYCMMNAGQNYYFSSDRKTYAATFYTMSLDLSSDSIYTISKQSIMDKYILIRDVYLFGCYYGSSNTSFTVFEDYFFTTDAVISPYEYSGNNTARIRIKDTMKSPRPQYNSAFEFIFSPGTRIEAVQDEDFTSWN